MVISFDIFKDGKLQKAFIDKFERFSFDTIAQARNPLFIGIPRIECFAPFKRTEGEDTPETVAKAISDLGKKWLKEAGAAVEISDESVVELSPAFCYRA
ncbi:MAG: hypothetical protein JRI96_18060 [Deltaproteobacteria bacterium]|nr:hypothetical protein [Deltaproteobacteria bacterium]